MKNQGPGLEIFLSFLSQISSSIPMPCRSTRWPPGATPNADAPGFPGLRPASEHFWEVRAHGGATPGEFLGPKTYMYRAAAGLGLFALAEATSSSAVSFHAHSQRLSDMDYEGEMYWDTPVIFSVGWNLSRFTETPGPN